MNGWVDGFSHPQAPEPDINLLVGCHYCCYLPSCTALLANDPIHITLLGEGDTSHVCMNDLPRVAAQKHGGQKSNLFITSPFSPTTIRLRQIMNTELIF